MEGRAVIRKIVFAIALVLAAPVHARGWQDFPGVANTSYREADGRRVLQLSLELPASPPRVYAMFSTGEAFASWATANAWVDFRTGGAMETSYNPQAKAGDPANIVNRIEVLVPDRLIVLRNIQAPPNFPGQKLYGETVTAIQIDAVGAGRSRITITNSGYGEGGDWETIYALFETGNAYTLDALRQRLLKPD